MTPEEEKYSNDRAVRGECLNMALSFCNRVNLNPIEHTVGISKFIYDFIMSDNPSIRTIRWRIDSCGIFISHSPLHNAKDCSISNVLTAVRDAENFLKEGGTVEDTASGEATVA